jgi:3-methyladenine DNA glycosylase AlkD
MILESLLTELRELGRESTAATYRRHGATGEVLGVSFAHLGKLAKRLGRDHSLARRLWLTGIADARLLAAMVADPAAMTSQEIEAWIDAAATHVPIDALVQHVAATMPARRELAAAWTASPDEWRGRAGWQLLAQLALTDSELPDSFFVPYLEIIRREIHARPNRAREAMNGALIAIGVRSAELETAALAVAAAIGPVAVDHGDTACKTPDAADYIRKTLEHRRKKSAHA